MTAHMRQISLNTAWYMRERSDRDTVTVTVRIQYLSHAQT